MKKFMSLLLSVLLVLSLVPMAVSATEADWNSFAYYQDGPVFSVEATEFTGSGSYKFYAAAYDAAGRLLAVKSDVADVAAGTLTAEVDFEPGNTEANVNIASVKTMLWEGVTPLTRNGEFAVTAQTETDGVYNSLTNGFYEEVEVNCLDCFGYYSYTVSGEGVRSYTALNGRTYETSTISDGRLDTANGFSATAVPEGRHYWHGAKLAEGVKADRFVLWTSKATSDIYLSTNDPGSSTMADYASKQTKAGLYYVGTLDAMDSANSKHVYDLAPTGESYKYVVIAADAGFYVGTNLDLAFYNKVEQIDVVDEYTLNVDYNGLAYSQDGPVFTVTAQEFETNANALYLSATAYAGANATGEVLASEKQALTIADTLTGSVNIEKSGEVNPLAASVKVEVVDSLGNNVLTAWTKNITPQSVDANGVYNNLTNGLYAPIIDGTNVTITELYRWAWTNLGEGYSGGWNEATGGLHDSNPATTTLNTGSISSGARVQYITILNKAIKVDRVVVYLRPENNASFYLANDVNYRDTGHTLRFNETDADGIEFLGNKNTQNVSTSLVNINGSNVARLVFNADGNEFKYLVFDADPAKGVYYGVNDFLPYVKVQDRYTVEAHETRVSWDEMTITQNGSDFTLAAEGVEANTDELYFEAVAYAADAAVATKKVAAALKDGNLDATVSLADCDTDKSITRVSVALKDADGAVLATAEDFAVAAPVSYSLLNGFYVPVTEQEGVTYTAHRRTYWNATTGNYAGQWWTEGDATKLYDGDIGSNGGVTTGLAAFGVQNKIELSASVKIDKVVAVAPYYMNPEYYLYSSSLAPSSDAEANAAYLAQFAGLQTNSEGVCYLGGESANSETIGNYKWMIADADGGNYATFIVSLNNTRWGGITELQAFTKVTATKTIASNK